MKIKKLYLFALIFVLIFALVACDLNKSGSSTKKEDPTVEPAFATISIDENAEIWVTFDSTQTANDGSMFIDDDRDGVRLYELDAYRVDVYINGTLYQYKLLSEEKESTIFRIGAVVGRTPKAGAEYCTFNVIKNYLETNGVYNTIKDEALTFRLMKQTGSNIPIESETFELAPKHNFKAVLSYVTKDNWTVEFTHDKTSATTAYYVYDDETKAYEPLLDAKFSINPYATDTDYEYDIMVAELKNEEERYLDSYFTVKASLKDLSEEQKSPTQILPFAYFKYVNSSDKPVFAGDKEAVVHSVYHDDRIAINGLTFASDIDAQVKYDIALWIVDVQEPTSGSDTYYVKDAFRAVSVESLNDWIIPSAYDYEKYEFKVNADVFYTSGTDETEDWKPNSKLDPVTEEQGKVFLQVTLIPCYGVEDFDEILRDSYSTDVYYVLNRGENPNPKS